MIDSQTGGNDGNSTVAPNGAVAVDTPNTTSTSTEPVRLTNDSLVQWDGAEKPVKFSEVRNFQSQFTRTSQELARARQALAEREAKLQQYEADRARGGQPNQPAATDPLDTLKQLPYLTGEEAAGAIQSVYGQIQQRDQFLIAALRKIQSMEKILGGLNETHTTSQFDTKINKWVTDLGYGPEAAEVAKEIYLAYEGHDLDTEFPRIFGERMKQLETLFEGRKRAQLEQSRRQPFIPGRGGQAGPSAPVKLRPNASPAEIADALWVNRGRTETT